MTVLSPVVPVALQLGATLPKLDVEFLVKEESFSDLVSLPNEVTFFVPSTDNVSEAAEFLSIEVIEAVSLSLATAYGGVTENAPGKGRWVSESSSLVTEGVTPITVYVAELTSAVQSHLISLARYILTTMHQESVLIVVNGEGKLLNA